jgi:hypothetical protein
VARGVRIWQARRATASPDVVGELEHQLSLVDLEVEEATDLMELPASSDRTGMQELGLSTSEPQVGRSLSPNRVSICPVELGCYGIDFTYHGATGCADAETAEQMLQAAGLTTKFIQELDGAWTVRFGPLPREQIRAVLDHYAW